MIKHLDATIYAASRLIFERLVNAGSSSCQLGEIIQTTSGGTPSRQNDSYYQGSIPWIKSGELNNGLITEFEEYITEEGLQNSSAKVFPAGTLVVALYGATVGKTGILGMDAATNQAVCALFPRSDHILVAYLHWFLRYKREDFLKLSFGGAQPNISQKILRETIIPLPDMLLQAEICSFLNWLEKTHASDKTSQLPALPFPLNDVPSIVARIEALASRVTEAHRLRAEASEETESLLSAKEMEIWPIDDLEDAPTLADVTQYLARGRQSVLGDSSHFLIKTRHVQMGKYVRSDMMLAEDIAKKVQTDAFAQYGDILIACSAAGCLGRVAQFDVIDQVASTDTHVAIARANPEIVLPEYLYAYLRGAQGQYQLRSRERGDWQREKISFRLTELNINDLQKVPVPVPSLDDQHRIVTYVDALYDKVAKVRQLQSTTQVELDALLPAILDKAFRGEL